MLGDAYVDIKIYRSFVLSHFQLPVVAAVYFLSSVHAAFPAALAPFLSVGPPPWLQCVLYADRHLSEVALRSISYLVPVLLHYFHCTRPGGLRVFYVCHAGSKLEWTPL